MKLHLLTLLFLAVVGTCLAGEEARTALVIGCDYAGSALQLPSPVGDANALASVIKTQLGFEVILLTNPGRQEFLDGIDRFGDRLAKRGGVGLFFFSGHGAQLEGENYLVPNRASISFREDLSTEAVSAARVVTRMEAARNRVNLLFLDACRDNPLPSSRQKDLVKGLAGMAAANGMLIGFATARNTAAIDSGTGSLFTNALLRNIVKPGISVTDMLTKVNSEVRESSGGEQVPFMEVGLSDVFYFVPGPMPQDTTKPSPRNPLPERVAISPVAEIPKASLDRIARVIASSVLNPQKTRAEGTITYEPRNVIDGKLRTAWVGSADQDPVGGWIQIDFSSPVRLSSLRIFGAYGKNRDMFQKNARIKTARMTTDSGKNLKLEFSDVMDFNRFELQSPEIVQSIRLQIIETFPGSKYRDTPISEIDFE